MIALALSPGGDQVAQREAESAGAGKEQALPAVCTQLRIRQHRPEEQQGAKQPQQRSLQPAQARSFTFEQPEIEAVEDAGAGENHRRQAARDIEGGVVETEEVGGKEQRTEQGSITLARPGQARKLAAHREQGEQGQGRQGETIEHRDLDGDGAELPGDGNPGAAPDEDGGNIEHQIHGVIPSREDDVISMNREAGGRLAPSCGFFNGGAAFDHEAR